MRIRVNTFEVKCILSFHVFIITLYLLQNKLVCIVSMASLSSCLDCFMWIHWSSSILHKHITYSAVVQRSFITIKYNKTMAVSILELGTVGKLSGQEGKWNNEPLSYFSKI